MDKIFDVIIVGAGPSGCACAISLKDSGLKVALLDKAVFPREKTCGDGLTLDVVKQLPLISEELFDEFCKLKSKRVIYGIKVYSTNHKSTTVSILQENEQRSMFTIKRVDFDNMFIEYIKHKTKIAIYEDCCLESIETKSDSIIVNTSNGVFRSSLIIGADGADSLVAKYLRPCKLSDADKAIALRNYYEGVNLGDDSHFIKFYANIKMLPGGLWVFPVGDAMVNVGLGVQSSVLNKKKINLKDILEEEINNGALKEAFINAKPFDKLKGHIIPLGKRGRVISGERFLLTGDAAGLANALSGEGIGNALRSGRVAAQHIIEGFEQGDFSKTFNLKYDKEIYRRMGREFYNYRLLQYLFRFPFIVNFLIGKVGPRCADFYNNPEFVARFQGKRFFVLRILKYIIFHKKVK